MAPYTNYETSTESSPSPRMLYNHFDSPNYTTYPNRLDNQYLHHQSQQQDILNTVEFTDLTAPVHEDRRRRQSTTLQDKQAISNMRIANKTPLQQRRRAQNRASQRAFRERKEKYVNHLEHELETLESKHRELMKSHSNLGEANDKLTQEVETLCSEIKSLKTFGEGGSMLGSPVSNDFDQFEQDGFFDSTDGDFTF
ncbi:MAG: hypothetical protein Q9170_008083 [Blastenia crenularia]